MVGLLMMRLLMIVMFLLVVLVQLFRLVISSCPMAVICFMQDRFVMVLIDSVKGVVYLCFFFVVFCADWEAEVVFEVDRFVLMLSDIVMGMVFFIVVICANWEAEMVFEVYCLIEMMVRFFVRVVMVRMFRFMMDCLMAVMSFMNDRFGRILSDIVMGEVCLFLLFVGVFEVHSFIEMSIRFFLRVLNCLVMILFKMMLVIIVENM